MRERLRYILALVAMLSLGTPVNGAPSTASTAGTFTWLGELLSMEPAARTMTVKVRVAYQEALSELAKFKAGEPVWVVWSGVSDYSDAVREFRRPEANRQVPDTLMMPAELVSPEATQQYVTLRVKVPEAAMAAVRNVKTGEWVTVTSRQRPAAEVDAVVSVRPYNEGSTATPSSTN